MEDQSSSPTAPNDSPGSLGSGTLLSQEAALILDRIKAYQRAPTALPAWLEHVKQGQHGSAARTFYEQGGFAAWFGYSLVKHASDHQTNFAGKTACKHLISRLDDSTTDCQRRIAAEVIERLPERDKRRIAALQRKLQLRQTQAMPFGESRRKRQRMANNDSVSPSPAPEPSDALSPTPTPSVREKATTHFTFSSLFFPYEDILVNASIQSVRKVFPEDLSNSIEILPQSNNRDGATAALSMSFPRGSSNGKQVCQMALEITQDKIQHFAQRWFGRRVEAKDGLRYLAYPDGSKIIPCPQFTVQGFRRGMLVEAFGPDIADAVQKSPGYQDDVRRGFIHTSNVSMIISHSQEATAQVYLSLALVEGTRIALKLFDGIDTETAEHI